MIQLPGPTVAPTLATVGSGTIAPAPLGTYEIAYTYVDKDNRHSAMSPPVSFTFDRHWWAIVRPIFTERFHPAVCFCVWWKAKGSRSWKIMGGQQYCQTQKNVATPYLPFTGWSSYQHRGHLVWLADEWPTWANSYWLKGSKIPAPALPLQVKVMYPPKHGFRAKWSWACDEGETECSPVIDIEPAAQDERLEVRIACNNPPRNGYHGRYLYVQESSTKPWKRLLAPNLSPLWPLSCNSFTIQGDDSDGQEPTGGGRSELCQLQLDIEASQGELFGHIEVTDHQIATSPIVVPYNQNNFYRTISARNGAQWILKALHNGPIWLEGNQRTRLVGCWMRSATACAGIDFIDTVGDGAMHFRGERIRIDLYNPNSGHVQEAYGVGCLADSRNTTVRGDHSCSEPVFTDLQMAAYHPVVIEGNQSANWTFNNLDASGLGKADNAIITLNSSNQVSVREKLTAENSRALVAVVNGTQISLEHVWIDQGIQQWFVVGNRQQPQIKCHFTRAHNHWNKEEQHVYVETCPARENAEKVVVLDISGETNLLDKILFRPEPRN
ncbi:MAG: hypothetical protein JNJ77_20085 [Planctomycetia bacterium]|nr:hypothetical protein [Planctomycetia bacterium]